MSTVVITPPAGGQLNYWFNWVLTSLGGVELVSCCYYDLRSDWFSGNIDKVTMGAMLCVCEQCCDVCVFLLLVFSFFCSDEVKLTCCANSLFCCSCFVVATRRNKRMTVGKSRDCLNFLSCQNLSGSVCISCHQPWCSL